MALLEIMERAAQLAAVGKGEKEIAEALEVSAFWVKMVMGTDAFVHLVEVERGKRCDAGGEGANGEGDGPETGQGD